MNKIIENFKKDNFLVIKTDLNGVSARFITDKTDTLYCKVESSKVSDPEDFKKEISDFDKNFEEIFYIKRTDYEKYYLYEIYL